MSAAVPGARTIMPKKYENGFQGRKSKSNVPTFGRLTEVR